MFNGRKLIVATMHDKEKVISPILNKELGINCFISKDFNSDLLGTFTGEIERIEDPIATARKKCLLAMELTGCDLAVASEGSFGPHPSIFFIPADDEFLLFIDKKNNLEIIERELTTETNFNSAQIKNQKELKEFALNAQFPSHGLIIRIAKDDFTEIVKGITNEDRLIETFNHFIEQYDSAFIETDMRAMFNPTRMKAIERATLKLVNKINSLCPVCSCPGFDITDVVQGLPCELCKMPTKSTLSFVYSCQKCNHSIEDYYPNGKFTEDPMYCDYCNP